jgi:nucleoside-diphosphate-sugar epimerase
MAERRETVIVTGSSGFIGEALVARLSMSFRVIGLDRQPAKTIAIHRQIRGDRPYFRRQRASDPRKNP